jgi:uncharacterized protein GlcG (DUF336 family)
MTDYILAPLVTLAAAQRATAAALEEARSLALEVCVAMTDSAEHLLAFARIDHAPILCVRIAVGVFGGSSEQDVQIAKAGAAVVPDRRQD